MLLCLTVIVCFVCPDSGFASPVMIFLSVTVKSVRWMISELLFIWWCFDPMLADTDDDFKKNVLPSAVTDAKTVRRISPSRVTISAAS